jgi:hypothetical protein
MTIIIVAILFIVVFYAFLFGTAEEGVQCPIHGYSKGKTCPHCANTQK